MNSTQTNIDNRSFSDSAEHSANGTLREPLPRNTDLGMWYYFQLDARDCKVSEYLRLGKEGMVVVANRAYSGNDEIDDEVAGAIRVKRVQGKRSILQVIVGEEAERYWFEYRPRFFAQGYWLKWVSPSVLADAPFEEATFPIITWKTQLWFDDMLAELGGFLMLLFFGGGVLNCIYQWLTGGE